MASWARAAESGARMEAAIARRCRCLGMMCLPVSRTFTVRDCVDAIGYTRMDFRWLRKGTPGEGWVSQGRYRESSSKTTLSRLERTYSKRVMGKETVITTNFTTESEGESLSAADTSRSLPGTRLKRPRRRRPLLWISLASVAFLLGLACFFFRLASGRDYSRFEPSLLTITVTFAVFAVNFSFLEYQLSPYRGLFRGIAWPHVLSATAVLLATVPVGVAIARPSPGRVVAFILPIIAVSSVVLALVARRCADPTQRIKSLLSRKRFDTFLSRLGTAALIELQSVDDLKLSSLKDSPSHEWDYRVPPKVNFFDPFDAAHALAFAAATNGDGQVFDEAVEVSVKMVQMAASKKLLEIDGGLQADYKVLKLVMDHARDRLMQLVRMTLDIDKTDRYAKGLANVLAAHLRIEAAEFRQNTEFARGLMKSLCFLAVQTYKKGWSSSAMRTLIVARECANKGISNKPKGDADTLFDYELVLYPLIMHELADAALDQLDANFLYRCMETLGYLGCSAVKAEKRDLGRQCAQSLVQISRRSRFLKMECFWTRCGMLPWQHARERLEWMLTWVARLPTDAQQGWLETFSEAYSRIDGKVLTITLSIEDEKPVFQFKRSGESHKMTYMDKDTVTYDYSDESMLRDLQLY